MASVEQGASYLEPSPIHTLTVGGNNESFYLREQVSLFTEISSTKDYRSLATSFTAATVVSGLAVYWLSAVQDGVTQVYWLSHTIDTSDAPPGHVYTHLHIQASWVL